MGNYQIRGELICRSRSAFVASAAIAAAFAVGSPEGDVRAGELYTENFNSYSGTQGFNQDITGLPVAYGGTITGWSKSGLGAIHAVRLTTGNWAPMFYDGDDFGGSGNNIITTASTIAGANTASSTYRVTFQVAPGNFNAANQATTASDAVVLSLLTSNSSTTLSSGTFFPGAFANSASSGTLAFQTATFDYQGTGSDAGALNLRFAANNPGARRFGGTVDNVILQTTARWNNGTSGTWSTGSNWLSGAAPVNTDLLVIGGTAGGTSTNNLAGLTAAGIEFASTAGSFTISGSAITLSGSNLYYNGVSNLSGAAQTLATDLVLGGITRTFNSVGRLTVNGVISDGAAAAGITKTGGGTLVLGGTNTYSGTTTISAGAVSIASTDSLPGWNTSGRFSVASGGSLLVGNGVDASAIPTLLASGSFAPGSYIGFDTVAGDRTVSSTFSGGYGLSSGGGNTLTLSASNSYTGGTLVGSGTLLIGDASALGTGTATIASGGALNLNNLTIANSVVLSGGTLTGGSFNASRLTPTAGTVAASLTSGTLTKSTAGTLTLSGNNTYSGTTTVSAGMLVVTSTSALPGWNQAGRYTIANNTTLTLGAGFSNGDVATVLSSGNFAAGATIGFDTTAGDRTYGTTLANTSAGALNLLKMGSGQMTLSASNTYTGNTTVSAGTLSISGAGKIYGGANNGTAIVTVASGAVLEFDKWDSGFADWGKGSFGQLYFDAGCMVVNGGTLRNTLTNASLAPAANDGRVFTIGALGATLESTAGQTWYVNADSRYGSLTSNGGLLTLGGAGNGEMKNIVPGTGGVTMAGSGTWTLSGTNTYSGDTTVAAGTLVAANASALGNAAGRIVAQGGVLDLGGRAFTRTGTVSFTGGTVQSGTLTNNTIAFDVQAGTVSAALSGSAGLTKTTAGKLTLTAANTYAGTTTVSAGRLEIAAGGQINSTSGITINGSSAEFKYNSATALTQPITFTQGTISGTGTIGTAVTAGTGDTLSPGNSPGTQAYTSGLTWDQGGTYLWEMSDATGGNGSGWDILNVSGGSGLVINATSGSTFKIAITSLSGTAAGNAANFSATTSGSWTILSSASGITGFAANKFTLDRAAFTNTSSGSFTLSQVASGTNQTLVLAYNTISALTSSTSSVTGFRVMQNQATTTAVNLLNAGPDATGYALASSAGLSLVSGSTGTLAASGTQAITFGYASTAATGARSGTVSFTNTGNSGDAAGSVSVSGAVVTDRVVTASAVDFGIVHLGASGTATSNFTSAGSDNDFTRITVANGSGGGLTVSGSSGFVFNGSGGSSRSVAGTFATAGALSGTISLTNASAEAGGTLPGQVPGTTSLAYSASVFSGTATWNVAGGGSWGSGASSSWTSTGGVQAAPGTFAGYTNTDVAIFAGSQGGTSTVLLNGATPSLAALSFTNTTARYVVDQGSGGSLTLAAASGKPTVTVVAGGLHEIKTAILGSAGLQKLGGGTLVLSGSNSYSGGTDISAGTLAVNGAISGGVNVATGATVGGSGSIVGAITGAGLVSPGNSPGILTAAQFDPSGGLAAAFELTGLAPTYASASASVNDIIRLTNLSDPFASGAFTSTNVIDVYFNLDSITNGQVYEGGFFTGLSAASLLAALDGTATFAYWAKTTGTPTRTFGGVDYVALATLPGITGITFQTAARTADFGSGPVTGSVTQFVVVPEPAAFALAGIGAVIAAWATKRSRRRASR